MRKLLLSLTVIAGAAGAAAVGGAAAASPLHPVDVAVPQVQTVQYYASDWRYRDWRRHEAHERWRRHHEWRRHYGYRGW